MKGGSRVSGPRLSGQTPIPTERPPGLSAEMIASEDKQRQWRAYAASIELESVTLEMVIEAIWEVVGPSCARSPMVGTRSNLGNYIVCRRYNRPHSGGQPPVNEP